MKIDPKKTVTSEPKTPTTPSAPSPSDETTTRDNSAIEARAYELWVQRGCPIGSPEVDWYQAEQELRGAVA
jgi:hypothetical protein